MAAIADWKSDRSIISLVKAIAGWNAIAPSFH
jgi:hypothetical protein